MELKTASAAERGSGRVGDGEAGVPLLSITVPCYRQLELSARCLDTILSQSFGNFEVTLLDDGDSTDYRRYADSRKDSRLRYHRNPTRLGAMRNMFQAIYFGDRKYSLAFHEDDLAGRHYLSAALDILESHPDCGFVATELHFFDKEPGTETLDRLFGDPAFELYSTPAHFLRAIFRGVEPMFGSIVYRREAIEPVRPALEELETLCDRPFLLEILKEWSGALLREPLAFCRRHDDGDDLRHQSLTDDQIVRFLSLYREPLPEPLSRRDRKLFYKYTGYWLFALHALIPPERRPPLRRFLLRAWREGIYAPQWLGRSGIRRLGKALLGREDSPT